ncbi:MAG: inorganic phosphate transporter [Candidatus Thorarchaeota archaeon]|nr:MAG: inorganic phosphate transporter [Candidatus Thorarchaeota archaeon]
MDLVLIALLGIGFIVGAAVGSNDETWSPAVGAHILTVTAAVAIGAIINFVGAVSLGGGVSNKVGGELVNYTPMTNEMVFAILISMAIWLLVASATKGLPISTTQCIVGAVMGIAAYAAFLGMTGWGADTINWGIVIEIFAGWIVSPIIGFFIAGVVYLGVRRFQRRAQGFTGRERQEQIAGWGLVIFLLITSLSRGGNDVANAVAPLVVMPMFQAPVVINGLVLPGYIVPLIAGGLGMAMGLIVVGRKVIKTLATEVVTLSPSSALSASVSVSLVMFVGTYFGFPLSGTHVLVAALIAVGFVAKTDVSSKQVKNIIISWIITVPISAVLAIAIFAGMLFII